MGGRFGSEYAPKRVPQSNSKIKDVAYITLFVVFVLMVLSPSRNDVAADVPQKILL
jgi:hypothetical protein